jgi:hypothetical protein
LKKSGIVSLTRSNPFAFSYAIGGEVAAGEHLVVEWNEMYFFMGDDGNVWQRHHLVENVELGEHS